MEVTPVRRVVPRGDEQGSSDTSACASKQSVTTTSMSSQVEPTSLGGKEAGRQATFLDYDPPKQDRPR